MVAFIFMALVTVVALAAWHVFNEPQISMQFRPHRRRRVVRRVRALLTRRLDPVCSAWEDPAPQPRPRVRRTRAYWQ